MLRSLRVLLVTILITLSLPLLQCDAQPAAAVKTGQTPLKVEVQLQSASGRATDYMAAEAPSCSQILKFRWNPLVLLGSLYGVVSTGSHPLVPPILPHTAVKF